MLDFAKNLAYTTLAASATSAATSLTVATGTGTRFPTPPFNATLWPSGVIPHAANAEIVRVTAVSGDVLTVTRAQESTSAITAASGDQIAQTITRQPLVHNLDPILEQFGEAQTAFEFNKTSLTGLTALGSPASEDAHTTVPHAYFVSSTDAAAALNGRYVATPNATGPWTAITKVVAHNVRLNYNDVGMFIAEAAPGKLTSFEVHNGLISVDQWTNRTTYASGPWSWSIRLWAPVWFAISVSASSATFYFSPDGWTWMRGLTNYAVGYTIGSVGLYCQSQNSSGVMGAFDFLRVYNSVVSLNSQSM